MGVKHACTFSPDFFYLYSDIVLRELESLAGFIIAGCNLNRKTYANNTVSMADPEEKKQQQLKKLRDSALEESG